MKTKVEYYLCLINKLLLGMFVLSIIMFINTNITKPLKYKINEKTLAINSMEKPLTKEDKVNNYLTKNVDLITFYSNTYQISKENLENIIKTVNKNDAEFNPNDLFNTGIIYKSADEAIINYLNNLIKTDKKLFSNKHQSCTKSKEYMIALIDYYTKIYTNVDPAIAKAIAQIESGYSAKGMLKKNNIFGGMSANGLISYKNIEYGILKYIELLSSSYFGKGLTTIAAIGKKYNPIILENNRKIANPSWVQNVTKAATKYSALNISDISEILSID